MWKAIPIFLLIFLSGTAYAHEFFVNAGVTRDTETGTARLQWSTTYLQEIEKHVAFSFRISTRGMRSTTIETALPASCGAVRACGIETWSSAWGLARTLSSIPTAARTTRTVTSMGWRHFSAPRPPCTR